VLWLVLVMGACAAPPGRQASPSGQARLPATNTLAPAERWAELLQHVPYPFARPLPPPEVTGIDGTYVKVEASGQVHWPCRRCPDFKPEDGLWRVSFGRGVFHIYYPTGDWASTSSYAVSGDRLELFNDPSCIDVIGRYLWRLDRGQLVLTVEDDPCAIELRAWNLTNLPWHSCALPGDESSEADTWHPPEGCE